MKSIRSLLLAPLLCLVLPSCAVDGSFVNHGRTVRHNRPSVFEINSPIHVPRGGASSARTSNGSQLSALPFLSAISSPFWQGAAIYSACDLAGFALSLATGSHVHLDLIGSGAFALAAIPGLSSALTHVQWSSYAQVIWGTKLAAFLFFRATQIGHDKRLEETLLTTAGMAQFWIVTLVWQVFCSLPYTMGMVGKSSGNPLVLKAGAVLYGAGLLIETTADLQKYFFKLANPGKFCGVGLWGISQHPNFFGNLLLWAGIFIMNGPSMIDALPPNSSIWQRIWGCRRFFVSLLGPLFMWNLFSGQAQGSMTGAVEMANSKYGSDPNYKKYIDEVPLIIPKLFK